MGDNVLIIGTLDTKGPEFAYLRDRIEELGLNQHLTQNRANGLASMVETIRREAKTRAA